MPGCELALTVCMNAATGPDRLESQHPQRTGTRNIRHADDQVRPSWASIVPTTEGISHAGFRAGLALGERQPAPRGLDRSSA
jgi:hypothetical protein